MGWSITKISILDTSLMFHLHFSFTNYFCESNIHYLKIKSCHSSLDNFSFSVSRKNFHSETKFRKIPHCVTSQHITIFRQTKNSVKSMMMVIDFTKSYLKNYRESKISQFSHCACMSLSLIDLLTYDQHQNS